VFIIIFEVFTAVSMKNAVFWEVVPFSGLLAVVCDEEFACNLDTPLDASYVEEPMSRLLPSHLL
jgi:hypothetical protein